MAYKGKCKNGKLSTPVTNKNGSKRFCKLAPKTSAGRSQDRKKKSGEAHEVRYRKKKRTMAKSKKRK